jgi:general secretion pathway protein G
MCKQRGFTLIELVIVIAVLGILAGIAIPRFLDSTASARGSKLVGDLRTIDSAIIIYQAKTGSFPTELNQLTETTNDGSGQQLLAAIPVPPNSTMLVEQNNGKEKSFTPDANTYAITNGRATYTCAEGDNKNLNFYLGSDFTDNLVSTIVSWQKGFTTTIQTNPYIIAQNAFLATGLTQELTSEEISSLLGGKTTDTTLYLKSATAVLEDGTLANIQFVTQYNTNFPNNSWEVKYNACAFIVNGDVYANINNNGELTSSNNLPSSVSSPSGNTLTSNAQLVQYLKRENLDANWFVSQLTSVGYTKIQGN